MTTPLLTPSHTAWLLGQMREVHGDVIIQEEYYPSKVGKLLAQKANATLLILPGGTRFDTDETYLSYIGKLASQTYAAVRGGKRP